MEYLLQEVNRIYPDVQEIRIKVIDTNAWHWNRSKEFSFLNDSKCDFHLDCPMSKCLGGVRGIFYKDSISEMVSAKEKHKQVKLTCTGYGGYNLTFHCDWYVVLDISIEYRTSQIR